METSEAYSLSRRDCEVLRIVASVLVVVVHCVHVGVEQYYVTRNYWSAGFLATCLDQFTRFTVPLFFFLSGFGLVRQYAQRPCKLGDYYRHRLPKIFLPFLLWSALTSGRHVEVIAAFPWHAAPFAAALGFLKFLFLDGFDYQYYFLIALFQFYLVFPILYRWARSPWALGACLLLHLGLLSPIETYLELLGWHLPPLHSHLVIFYLFYCLAGMHAAWNPRLLANILDRWTRPGVAWFWVGTLCLLMLEYCANLYSGKRLCDTDHFNRWSVVLYCLASMMLFLKNKDWVLRRIHRNPHWAFLFSGVAPYTFFVYLAHTHLLRLADAVSTDSTVVNLVGRTVLVVAGSYGLAWAVQWLLQDAPWLRFALGMPKAPLEKRDLPGYSWWKSRRFAALATEGSATAE